MNQIIDLIFPQSQIMLIISIYCIVCVSKIGRFYYFENDFLGNTTLCEIQISVKCLSVRYYCLDLFDIFS